MNDLDGRRFGEVKERGGVVLEEESGGWTSTVGRTLSESFFAFVLPIELASEEVNSSRTAWSGPGSSSVFESTRQHQSCPSTSEHKSASPPFSHGLCSNTHPFHDARKQSSAVRRWKCRVRSSIQPNGGRCDLPGGDSVLLRMKYRFSA